MQRGFVRTPHQTSKLRPLLQTSTAWRETCSSTTRQARTPSKSSWTKCRSASRVLCETRKSRTASSSEKSSKSWQRLSSLAAMHLSLNTTASRSIYRQQILTRLAVAMSSSRCKQMEKCRKLSLALDFHPGMFLKRVGCESRGTLRIRSKSLRLFEAQASLRLCKREAQQLLMKKRSPT